MGGKFSLPTDGASEALLAPANARSAQKLSQNIEELFQEPLLYARPSFSHRAPHLRGPPQGYTGAPEGALVGRWSRGTSSSSSSDESGEHEAVGAAAGVGLGSPGSGSGSGSGSGEG